MYIQEDDLNLNEWQFSQRKYLDYKTKLRLTRTRIQEWSDNWNGLVYISFSGGLDSTVLLHLVRSALGEDVPAVFSDTGLEFPELREFVKTFDNVTWIKPKMPFTQVIKKYGYPIISKETAAKIRKLRHGNLSDRYRNYLLNGDERGKLGMLAKKWQFLINAPFDTSEKCCDVMKKTPFREYHKQTGRVPFIGVTQDESFMRERQYARTGCNVYDAGKPKSQPLGFWTKQDVLRYVVENQSKYDMYLQRSKIKPFNNKQEQLVKEAKEYIKTNKRLEICSVYGEIREKEDGAYYLTGEQRTGCVFCAFGCHLESEPNRFQRLEQTHPQLYKYCMDQLGMKKVLDYVGIPTTSWEAQGQMNIEQFIGEVKS